MKAVVFGILTSFLVMGFVHAKEMINDSATGEVFPQKVEFEHDGKTYQLDCTGVTTRKKFFIKVYSIASYMQQGTVSSGSDKFQAFLQDNNAKQLTLKFVRDVDAARITDAFREHFQHVLTDAEQAKLKSEIDTFIHFFDHNVSKGEQQVLRWLPGGYVEVIINGNKVGSITNKDFAKGLWSIWFGPKSVVDRNSLVSLIH